MTEPNWINLLAKKRSRRLVAQPDVSSSSELEYSRLGQQYLHYDDRLPSSARSPRSSPRSPDTPNSSNPNTTGVGGVPSSLKPDGTGEDRQNSHSIRDITENIVSNGAIERMADALQVAMMTKPAHESLGPEYKSSILHLLEDRSQTHRKLSKAKKKLVEYEIRRERELERLEDLTERWCIREARYKAEIKRLELLIHGGSTAGMEAVLLARSGSLLEKPMRCSSDIEENGDEIEAALVLGIEKRKYGENVTDYDSIIGRPRVMDMNNDIKISQRLRDKQPIDIGRYNPDREEVTPCNNGRGRNACSKEPQHLRSDIICSSFGGKSSMEAPCQISRPGDSTSADSTFPYDEAKLVSFRCDRTEKPALYDRETVQSMTKYRCRDLSSTEGYDLTLETKLSARG